MARWGRPRRQKQQKQQKIARVQDKQFTKKIEAISDDDLALDLSANLDRVAEILGHSNDLVRRRFHLDTKGERQAALIFIDGMVSVEIVDKQVLHPLMHSLPDLLSQADGEHKDLPEQIRDHVLPIGEVKSTGQHRDVIKSVLQGDTVLLIDGCAQALLMNTKGWEKRGVEEPRTEAVVRGPRDGFAETMRINTALLRRRIKDPDLRAHNFTVGTRSRTDITIMYIEGVAEAGVVDEIKKRIEAIEVDGVLDSGYIEQYIEDSHWSPFPLIQNTERPDKAAANLLEGKVIVLVDGSPFVLIAPAVFTQFYHSPEDYYERFLIATLVRFIRALSMTMALLLPSLYISFSSFHPEMIPSKLVIAMAAGRATVPFPSVIEALLMEVSIEILREASVRLPGPIGPTIGIVGALIVGEAAVKAGIVSPIMVIVVALTTIGSFAAPSYNAAIAIRMLRFPIMFLAAMFGLYGIMLFLIVIVVHLCSLKSFGVPYLSPFTPRNFLGIGDTLIRIPLFRMKKRPSVFVDNENILRNQPESAEDVKQYGKPQTETKQRSDK
ncbi:MAG TPA: spore germination protein [Bacilli bacterium]|nr:spore germination protein [Bacilli bacterium]